MSDFDKGYWWGGPRSETDKSAYLTHIYRAVCAESAIKGEAWKLKDTAEDIAHLDPATIPSHHPVHTAALDRLDGSLARITDKSNGLLQVAGIFIAIAALIAQILADAEARTFSGEWPIPVGTGLLVVSAGLLAANLGVLWRKDEHRHLGTYKFSSYVLGVLVNRCRNFQFARILLIIGGVLIVAKFFALSIENWS